jgi:hypothetical protein
MSDPTYANNQSSANRSSSSPAGAKAPATRNPFEAPPRPVNQSKDSAPAFAFDPPTLTFASGETKEVAIRNTTSEPQTIDDWQVIGDAAAFHTAFVGSRSLVIESGKSFFFRVRFSGESDKPQTAALIVGSTFAEHPARLNVIGIKRGEAPPLGCSGVSISASTPEGRGNSIQSAMASVGAAWSAVRTMQERGVTSVANIVGKELPKVTSEWKTRLDGVIAQGLSNVIGALSAYLGGGLALATWDVLRNMNTGKEANQTATDAMEAVASLTLKVHQGVTSSYAQGVLTTAATAVREAIEGSKQTNVSALMRESFFDAQTKTMALAYADAVTTFNNSEGDFAALESSHPGLGFAALEAYRNHLSCHQGNVAGLQRSATLGMWMAFLAQLDVGKHEPEQWEHAKPGAALEKNIYNTTDAHHRLRDLARGVVELHVIWDYDHIKTRPIYQLERARVSGIHPELKQLLTGAPLGQFSMPIIVHGKVKHDTPGGTGGGSQLRIGRNEGGALTIGAEAKTKSAEMLETLGGGDTFAGARALFEHVDQMTLTKVE